MARAWLTGSGSLASSPYTVDDEAQATPPGPGKGVLGGPGRPGGGGGGGGAGSIWAMGSAMGAL